MDMLEKNSCLRFVEYFEKIYLERQDIPSVLKCLDQDICWISTGEKEICYGIQQVRRLLYTEDRMPCYSVVNSQYDLCMLGEGIYSIRGSLKVREPAGPLELPAFTIHISMVCYSRKDRFLLKQVHLSAATPLQRLQVLARDSNAQDQDTEALRKLVRKQSAKLRVQSQDIQALMDNIPGGVMCCDYTGELNLLQYSQGFLEMFGYSEQDLEQKFHNQFSKMIYPEDLEKTWIQVRRQLQEGNTKEIQYRVLHKDGRLIDVLDRGQRVYRDNGESVFYCILTDITESKRAQEELRLSLERHKIIMDQSQDIIFEWDIKKDTLLFSTNWEKNSGMCRLQKKSVKIFQTYRIFTQTTFRHSLKLWKIPPPDEPILKRKLGYQNRMGNTFGVKSGRPFRRMMRMSRQKPLALLWILTDKNARNKKCRSKPSGMVLQDCIIKAQYVLW